jgi:serine/threonine-protein kinase
MVAPMPPTTCPSCEGITDTSSRSCQACGEPLPVAPGWVIANRYEIQESLGEGGMGAVFRARDRALQVTVAFKVLRFKADRTATRRFHHEVALARKVRHENVCAVYEFGEDKDILYCTMELVGGRNLRQVLREGLLPFDRSFRLALEVAAGLQAIHEAGVLHRDLKASNIMIDAKGRVRLLDFGIAKAMPAPDEEAATSETPLTGRDAVVGTPAYMSPEQVMGWPLDARSDIYSFGIVLFELFTGEMPFHGGSRAATMRKHLEERPPLDGTLGRALPTQLVPVLQRALEKDPDLRYANVAALMRDLERARDSFRTDTLDAVPPALPRSWLVIAIVLVGGIAIAEWIRLHSPAEAVPPPITAVPTASPPAVAPIAASSSPPTPLPAAKPARRSVNPRPTPLPPPPTTLTPTTTTTTVPPVTVAAAPATTVPTTLAPPPPTTLSAKPIETRPHCISCPPPSYPPAAEKYGLAGTVELEIMIDENGNVTGTHVLSGHSAFRAAAEKVVRGWRFVPATINGVPVKYTMRQLLEFTQSGRR